MPTTRRGGVVLAEERHHTTARRLATRTILLVLAVGIVVAGWMGVRGVVNNFGSPQCQATALGVSVAFDPAQTANAATIAAVAEQRGLPARAATIAIATAIQESKLRNLKYGDLDSVGLFQQRPSQGWGRTDQILDPVYASNRFYDALVKIPGYETMKITEIAQKVQKSAYPDAYASHEQEGRLLASALLGHSPGGLGCRLDAAATGNPASLKSLMARELGTSSTVTGRQLIVHASSERTAWTAGSYAVAKASQFGAASVQVGAKKWTRTRDSSGWQWQKASGSADAMTVTVTFP
jgi:hypothetical protein